MSVTAKPNYVIRNIRLSDCDEVRDIWRSVNFGIVKYANEVMINLDPNGIFVVEDTDSGKLLGYVAAVNLSDDLAFIGGYCVRPDYRGHGIGQKLWNTGMAHMGDRNVGLFAFTVKMFEIYRDHHNFKCIPDRYLHHFRGQFNPCADIINEMAGISVVAITDANVSAVVEYDKAICGLDRRVMISGFAKTPGDISLVAVNERNEVLGYSFLLQTVNDEIMTFEPLYANDPQIAELLGNKCCQLIPANKTTDIYCKCWNFHHKSHEFAKRLGLKVVRDQLTSFTKEIVNGDLDKITANI
ncbi:unnamed protein product [Oppiella nova]|uniref:N-acetyltransferase domain-containing protein n=1 Tax=Oppiella nova TaxID=334625 RepID=A0A7R9QPK6_9ACAR|nr:unnamed protein product [Oppiella nova]CAG2170741.1 unnamed protein product [Oppiella nova]